MLTIEAHYLSTIYDEINACDADIKKATAMMNDLRDGISGDSINIGLTAISERISANKTRVSSSAKACEKLNSSIRQFLGHAEIYFEVNNDETGYLIKRGDDPAKNLSEGEKTAAAFVFFLLSSSKTTHSMLKTESS